MKEKFEQVEIEAVVFEAEDVITNSNQMIPVPLDDEEP